MGDLETTDFSKERLLAVLRGGGAGEVPQEPGRPLHPRRSAAAGSPRRSPAAASGCCMQTMGTPWEIDLDGAILFFEDYHLPPYYPTGS